MTENKANDRNLRRRLQFEIFSGTVRPNGIFEKTRQVGLGFLREGKHEYKFKLFPLLGTNYFLKPVDTTQGTYKVWVRDEIKSSNRPPRTYWCEVGDGLVIGALGFMEIKIDLCGPPIYMNIFPREIKTTSRLGKIADLKLVA
jgi:hypothetical protein